MSAELLGGNGFIAAFLGGLVFGKTILHPCSFLFEFMDHLATTGLSESTLRKHESNCWAIGCLECQYGYHDTFSSQVFAAEPSFLYEFKRKWAFKNNFVFWCNTLTSRWRE